MYNLYRGNSGSFVRMNEGGSKAEHLPSPSETGARGGPAFPERLLKSILPEKLGELESEDLILLLILYLMYKESGDTELLIIMGAMFLL